MAFRWVLYWVGFFCVIGVCSNFVRYFIGQQSGFDIFFGIDIKITIFAQLLLSAGINNFFFRRGRNHTESDPPFMVKINPNWASRPWASNIPESPTDELEMPDWVCSACGESSRYGASFCTSCGQSQ